MTRRRPSAGPPPPIDPTRVRTVPLARRPSKVAAASLGTPVRAGLSVRRFLDGLPDILAARDLRDAAARVAAAIRARRPVVLGMGAHAIKVGLGPLDRRSRRARASRGDRHERRRHRARLRDGVGRTDLGGRRPRPRPRSLRHGGETGRLREPRHARGRGRRARARTRRRRRHRGGAPPASSDEHPRGGRTCSACPSPCTSRSAPTSSTCIPTPTAPRSARDSLRDFRQLAAVVGPPRARRLPEPAARRWCCPRSS